MKGFSLRTTFLTLTLAAMAWPASALTVVNTSAPQINCVFSTTCSVVVTDMGSSIMNGGFIQSRIFQAQPGSPAYPNWVYEYRVNLTNAVGITHIGYVTSMSLSFGPVLNYDYNADGNSSDQVFVVTQGGLGTIGLSSAWAFFGAVGFNLASPVSQGSFPGNGQSSYFFGLVSPYPPVVVNASVNTDTGTLSVPVYAPAHP